MTNPCLRALPIATNGEFCLDNAFVLIDVALTCQAAVWLLLAVRPRQRRRRRAYFYETDLLSDAGLT
jgi:hypothetical protein